MIASRYTYTHLSDQFGPFATQTIPATVNEAPYILDGLLMWKRAAGAAKRQSQNKKSPPSRSAR